MNTVETQSRACSLTGKPLSPNPAAPALPAMEADFWDRRYGAKEFVWTAEANQFLAEEAASLAPGKAIDMAAGEGRNAFWMAERGWQVYGVDFSDVAMQKASRLAESRGLAHRVTFETADLRQFELQAQSLDLVAFVYLQIPLQDLKPILKRAVSAVAPGGTLLFIAHDTDNLTMGFGGPQQPDLLYRVSEIVEALGDELVIEKAEQVERLIKLPDRDEVAIDMVVRAKRV